MPSDAASCPDADTLTALVEGALEDDELTRVEEHTVTCAECGELLGALRLEPEVAGALPGPGAELGGYRLERELGRGAYGTVFEATDLTLGRRVALKLLRRSSPQQRAGVEREARALARLRHPGVVTVHEVGEADGRPYIVMELIEGETLERRVESMRDPHDVARLFVAAGRGLAAAHHAGVVHRDFKPSNVMVTASGQPKVVDFGQAVLDPQAAADAVVGTPAYMAPEQHRGVEVDARADQYAFAVSLVRALLGRSPFPSRDPEALLATKEAGLELPRDELGLPAGSLDALARALSPDPADRFRSLDEMLDEIAHHVEHLADRRRIMRDVVPWLAAGFGVALLPALVQRPLLLAAVVVVAALVAATGRVDPSRWRGHGFTVVMPWVLVGGLWASHLAAIESVDLGYRNSAGFAALLSFMLVVTALWARPWTSLLCGALSGLGYAAYWFAFAQVSATTGADSFANMSQRAMTFVGVGVAAAGLARALRRYTSWFSDERPDPR